ncbi:Acyl-CoA N-acyltransferase [Penicillium expansum]|uniref:Acyl-CoA N-acyltransferase n=1 Tax=Penicillium expansum TaxID=27334 RepID=A0A0A2J0J2_PENEN|nr:Acyl-CoA N-acyltransferase [Penicillium expansum]KGO48203.1 Acyl-CoA N-acyltransferase [Penicillium expansum]KGO61318.1 Acyl-CoA N-acyltransferase [Penicillium expansum]
MACQRQRPEVGLRIDIIHQPEDIIQAFGCVCEAFGRQVQDGIWIAMNPGWDTPQGRAFGAERMVARWRHKKNDKNGLPNTIFLKATLPCPQVEERRIIVGFCIWVQASSVEGHGDPPVGDIAHSMGLNALYPDSEPEQRYLCQTISSLHRRRNEVIKQKAIAAPPAVMILDMCAVDPAHQRKGIARGLVQWGIDEAQRRGGLEAITEASSMGRHVYGQMGFQADGPEIEYVVDDEFASRRNPPNLFMRTHGALV